MRNPANWQVYALGSQPTMPYGGRGYTGHEHLNQFGIINMNARLYDPLLARFLAPDPLVGSGMANDFNRYIYCKNNPLMFTDPSGESWKSFWSDFGNAFIRDFKRTFISDRPGLVLGYNSMGGGFINATYNGRAIGPSVGINNSGGITTGNTINGFHQMKSITPQIDQAAMQMYQANNELQQIRNNQENWKMDKIYTPQNVISNYEFSKIQQNIFSISRNATISIIVDQAGSAIGKTYNYMEIIWSIGKPLYDYTNSNTTFSNTFIEESKVGIETYMTYSFGIMGGVSVGFSFASYEWFGTELKKQIQATESNLKYMLTPQGMFQNFGVNPGN